jgi:hypothetical protein
LQLYVGIAEVFEPQLIEIVRANFDREVFAPIVADPFIEDHATRLERRDPVRP